MDKRYNNGRNFPKDFPFHEKQEEDDFIHIPNERHSGGRKPFVFIIILLVIAGAGYGLFKTFYEIGHSISSPTGGTIPVITANDEPFKEIPENPGGLKIPHLDKQIYNKLDKELGSTIDKSEDELLPLPNRDDLMAQLVEEEDKKQQIKRVISDKKKIPAFREDDEKITIKEDAKPSTSAAKNADESPKAKRIDVEKVLAKKNLQEIWVQLGTFKAEDEATKAWQEVRENNSDIFGDVGIRVTKSENNKGSYYRLQSGPIYNEDEARELCKKLNSRQQSCFYVNTKD